MKARARLARERAARALKCNGVRIVETDESTIYGERLFRVTRDDGLASGLYRLCRTPMRGYMVLAHISDGSPSELVYLDRKTWLAVVALDGTRPHLW